jgi:GGDEF domain-containing protein
LLPFRPGGDEFTMVLTADDPEILQKLVGAVNQVVIEDSIKKIKTQYGIANSENVIEVVEGNVEIKYGKPIDESRPLIEDSNEESQIKALLYDLILCEINLVPDPDHLNNAFKDVENYGDPTTPLTDRFKDYFKSHWETVLERETSLPDYCEYVINENNEKVAAIDKETLLLDAEALCAKFPGVQILVDIAKKADKYVSFDYINHFYPDLIAGPYKRPSDIFSEDEEVIIINGVNIPEEVRNFNLRSLIQLLSDNLFDPVVGEKVYNKHAFDELVKYEQLSGLVVFKEVIKPVNDNLGLANGDKVIRDFFHSIRAQIPAELEKYIIYGRGQADILIGFNRNEIDKISDENDRLSVISQINQTIDNLGQMQTFESLIEKNKENIKFTMNTGVGAAKLDPQTGALVPAEMGKCFDAAETDYDLKYVSLILKNNPAKICKTLLLKPDITDKLNSDPDLWNLHKYLNDPKRGVINTSRILKNLKENISQLAQYLNIADLQAEIVLLEESLTQLRRKLEIERTIRQLENENTELEKNLGNNNLTDKLPRLKIAVNINELAYQERMLDDLNSEVEKEFDKIESNRIFA